MAEAFGDLILTEPELAIGASRLPCQLESPPTSRYLLPPACCWTSAPTALRLRRPGCHRHRHHPQHRPPASACWCSAAARSVANRVEFTPAALYPAVGRWRAMPSPPGSDARLRGGRYPPAVSGLP